MAILEVLLNLLVPLIYLFTIVNFFKLFPAQVAVNGASFLSLKRNPLKHSQSFVGSRGINSKPVLITALLFYGYLVLLNFKLDRTFWLHIIIIFIFIVFLAYFTFLKVKIAMFSSCLIYAILLSIDQTLLYFAGQYLLSTLLTYEGVVYPIITALTCLITLSLTALIQRRKKKGKESWFTKTVFLTNSLVALVSITILLILFYNRHLMPQNLFILFKLLIAIATIFIIFENISKSTAKQMDEKLTKEQNKYYEQQIETMKSTLNHYETLRHDLKNKLSPLQHLANSGELEGLKEQIQELTEICHLGKEYATSPNDTINNIVNFKLQSAESKEIRVTVEIQVPVDLDVPSFDLAIVMGNLLDNALEGVEHVQDKWMKLSIKYSTGCLILTVSNSFDGVVIKKGTKIHTRKEDQENHGFGLQSVEATTKKYNGEMQIDYDENTFIVRVLMYV